MAKISIIEPLVEKALRDNVAAREDNYILYIEVLENYIHVDSVSFKDVCLHHVELGIPSLESITRCRRKLQEKFPELAGENRKVRENEEQIFREYSRS